MSVDTSRINYPVLNHLKSSINIPESHFLIKLSTNLPWNKFSELAIADLYRNTKQCGRKLNLRLHLGAFILQLLFKWTDRELEENINYYAPARLFCGLEERKSYDHSNYVKFRNRISEDTVKKFNINLLKVATNRGFTGGQFMDFDSTVQEANILYPSTANMMRKIIIKAEIIFNHLIKLKVENAGYYKEWFNFESLKKSCIKYAYIKGDPLKNKFKFVHFSNLIESTRSLRNTLVNNFKFEYKKMKWNIKKHFKQISMKALYVHAQALAKIENKKYFGKKIYSLHADEVSCIAKGKSGKPYEFGRKWFIGRLPGNYAIGFTDKNTNFSDSLALEKGIKDFKSIFKKSPKYISADSGFWSKENIKAGKKFNIDEIGIKPKGRKEWLIERNRIKEISCSRAKVEPIIGHLKKRGMGKTKMKSDKNTILCGQRAILSLNTARFIKDLYGGKMKWSG